MLTYKGKEAGGFLKGVVAALALTLAPFSLVDAQIPLIDKEATLNRFLEKGGAKKCEEFVEWGAKYQHRWLDDSRYPRWDGPYTSVDNGRVVYMFYGWNVQFQNRYGAWSRMGYVCGVDPLMTQVLHFEIDEM